MSSIFYENESAGIKVTEAMVIDGGASYPLRNIGSVKLAYRDIPWLKNILKMTAGGLFLTLVLGGIGNSMIGSIGSVLGSLIGIAGTAYAVYLGFKSPREIYYASLATNSGEVNSFESADKNEVLNLVNAINAAISKL